MQDHIEETLIEHGIQATAMRIMVMRCIMELGRPVSLNELEAELETVDKSTISRALNLFAQKGLLHEVNDGSGYRRYCLHSHSHIHFTCIKCHTTECIESVTIPEICIPEGYSISEQSFVIKGICPRCKGDD